MDFPDITDLNTESNQTNLRIWANQKMRQCKDLQIQSLQKQDQVSKDFSSVVQFMQSKKPLNFCQEILDVIVRCYIITLTKIANSDHSKSLFPRARKYNEFAEVV